ncbi:MAG: hypothetical protein MH472_02585 [Bacteroidia bacterium]|nr:hypothetical protein [Bacteroidia bacterium]
MKAIQTIILSALMAAPFLGKAQFLSKDNHADLNFSSNGKQSAISASAFHMHYLGSKKKFGIGYGLRYTGNMGSNSEFTTAPAKLTKEEKNLDTLSFGSHQVNSLNLAIYLQYNITPKLAVEFNIDALGFSFGSNETAKYNSSKRSTQAAEQTAKPTSLNALLVGDNDIGSLSSEMLIRYKINDKFSVKAGAAYIFTEYTTDNSLYVDNNRFRNKSMQGMLGVSYRFN